MPLPRGFDKAVRHQRQRFCPNGHLPIGRDRPVPGGAGYLLVALLSLGDRLPALRSGDTDPVDRMRPRDVRIPMGLPAEIDTLAADVSRGLARRHKAEMARFTWRIVEHALIAPFHGQGPIRSERPLVPSPTGPVPPRRSGWLLSRPSLQASFLEPEP